MTSLPMVSVAWFAKVSLEADRRQWRPRFFPVALTPKPANRDPLGKNLLETVYHGDSLKESGAHAKPGERRWEKSKRNPFMMAIPPIFDGDCAKTRGWLGENQMGTRLSWRFPQEKAVFTPKPATRGRFGKIPSGTRLSWRFSQEKRRLRQNQQAAWGKSKWKPFIMAIVQKSEIGLARPFGLAKP